MPDEVEFRTKPQIALAQIARVLTNGVRVAAWTFDELYGRDSKFLDGLEAHGQMFVCEIPVDFHGWLQRPKVQPAGRKSPRKGGRPRTVPRVARRRPSCEVRNLLTYSPVFRQQAWQPYRIKDTDRGPEVWEVKWAEFWRKNEQGLPTRKQALIVARNVLTGEVKYFLSNRVPGERNPVTGVYVTLRGLLCVAFGRWSIESCFRQAKQELGMDHYQVRGWRCVHRHFYATQLSQLFCARVRQEFDTAPPDEANRLTVEQVRSAVNVWLDAADLPAQNRRQRYQHEWDQQAYHQRRNAQSRRSHTKTRRAELAALGIDVDRIKSCVRNESKPSPTPLPKQTL